MAERTRNLLASACILAVLAGLWLALAARPGRARESRVSPQDLPAALARARPGDTLLLANGAYRDQALRLEGRGAEGAPITLRASTPGGVVFTGRSSLELRGSWLVLQGLVFDRCVLSPLLLRDTVSCRVTECALLRCNPEDTARIHWIRIAGAGSRDNRVDHCYTEGKLKDGVVLTVEGADGKMPQGTRIDRNHFKEVVRAVPNGMETVRVGTSDFGDVDSHTVVEQNLFERCSGDPEIISSKSSKNVYRYNTFLECDGGLVMRHGHACTAEGNFFLGRGRPRTAGVRLHGADHRVFNNYLEGLGQFSLALPAGQDPYVKPGHERAERCLLAHNTIVEPAGPAIVTGADRGKMGREAAPSACVLLNNLVAGAKGPLVQIRFGGTERWAGNLFHATAPAQLGIAPMEGILQADARLQRAADGLLRPAEGSPALAAATPVPFALADDMDGQPRTGPADAGADQRSSAPPPRRPLRPEDVGPGWRH